MWVCLLQKNRMMEEKQSTSIFEYRFQKDLRRCPEFLWKNLPGFFQRIRGSQEALHHTISSFKQPWNQQLQPPAGDHGIALPDAAANSICTMVFLRFLLKKGHHGNYLVGGFNPSEKYARQIGSSSPSFGVKIKNLWNHHLVMTNHNHHNNRVQAQEPNFYPDFGSTKPQPVPSGCQRIPRWHVHVMHWYEQPPGRFAQSWSFPHKKNRCQRGGFGLLGPTFENGKVKLLLHKNVENCQ